MAHNGHCAPPGLDHITLLDSVGGGRRLDPAGLRRGPRHYDDPPPEVIDDLEDLRVRDRFRFANVLQAWVEVDGSGSITDCGYDGGGLMGSTTVKLGPVARTFEAIGLPDIFQKPVRGDGWVRFVQTELDRGALQELSKDHRRTQPDRS
jgi:hypothetical protein